MALAAIANMPNTQNFLRLRRMGRPSNEGVNMQVRQIRALCNPVRQVVQIRLVQRVCRQRNSHRSRISSDARFAVKCPTKCPDALGLGAIRRGNDLEGGIQMRKESVVSISVFIAGLAFQLPEWPRARSRYLLPKAGSSAPGVRTTRTERMRRRSTRSKVT